MPAPRRATEIHAATLRILTERGYDGLTIEGVAAAAGVNKTTIYRWWPGKDELIADSVRESHLTRLDTPDTGSLRGDVEALLNQVADILTSPTGRSIAAATITDSNPAITAFARNVLGERAAIEQTVLDRAVGRGEIADTDARDLFVPAMGALWLRILVLREDPQVAHLADRVVKEATRGT
ncbi:TetR/AcrR family transcriptional regulator [Tsukamurella sp. 8F]|uniref:TetR/AcrR family transcriptional regulator n=1 Tax=unclassified Tsukamurella TaxID=2633480 RepID=UPI0023BA3CFC|nr:MULTISPECIES: TetR/AcrR family transcriptional regulator [unclassified Tsukamurella]MDF0531310.1 TetR/AcrR family transcriptional regulator [Tsukamurella sp. 8J]MDF0585259.1 TetR/AcrR family transcriptional regulator [Tsukamurella sp. 8F]